MDSRIEELAEIIIERCKEYTETDSRSVDPQWVDKVQGYGIIHNSALNILEEIKYFRQKYKHLYKD